MIASIRVAGSGDGSPAAPHSDRRARSRSDDAINTSCYTVEERDRKTVATAILIRPGPLVGNQVSILEGLQQVSESSRPVRTCSARAMS